MQATYNKKLIVHTHLKKKQKKKTTKLVKALILSACSTHFGFSRKLSAKHLETNHCFLQPEVFRRGDDLEKIFLLSKT